MIEPLAVTVPHARFRFHLEALHYAWERGQAERGVPHCQSGSDLLTNAIAEIELDEKLLRNGPAGMLLRTLRKQNRSHVAAQDTAFTNGLGGKVGFPVPWFVK